MDYQDLLDTAQEYCVEPGDPPPTPFDSAMQRMVDHQSRCNWATWAVSRHVQADDPIWHVVEMIMIVNETLEETLQQLERQTDRLREQLIAETKQQLVQLQREGQQLISKGAREFSQTMQQTAEQLIEKVQLSVEESVRQQLRDIWQRGFWRLVSFAGIAILLVGLGAVAIGYAYLPPRLSEEQSRALSHGTTLNARYLDFSEQQREQLHELMGWSPPLE